MILSFLLNYAPLTEVIIDAVITKKYKVFRHLM